jgi:hypothetical protein
LTFFGFEIEYDEYNLSLKRIPKGGTHGLHLEKKRKKEEKEGEQKKAIASGCNNEPERVFAGDFSVGEQSSSARPDIDQAGVERIGVSSLQT